METLSDLPNWVTATALIVTFLAGVYGYANWSLRRAQERVARRRANPSRQAFLADMSSTCSKEVLEFLWERSLAYVEPRLTPHPDDDLILDLRIDDDDVTEDWPRDWARQRGFHESNLPGWPEAWPTTIRNFGRWLDLGPR